MALKLTSQNQNANNKLLFKEYNKYDKRTFIKGSYQYAVFNEMGNKDIIDSYNHYSKFTLKKLKGLLDDYEKKDFKDCGFKLNCKEELIKWNMNMPNMFHIGDIDTIREPNDLMYILYHKGSKEDLLDEYYNNYIYPTYKKYINLMKDLKPYLRQIKDNTIICKNEQIFTIILLAKNDMRINYNAMKNIISYL